MSLSTHIVYHFASRGKEGNLLTLESSLLSDTAKVGLGRVLFFFQGFCKLMDISGAVSLNH